MGRLKFATAWLGGCSGCHMSFLDLDEWLFDLAQAADVVFSPLADVKEYPAGVDVALVEGAVANADNAHLARQIRARTRTVVAFGDCAVTGNVTALRNCLGGSQPVIERSYLDARNENPSAPAADVLPILLEQVRPLHQVIPVDVFLPGCPPPAERIRLLLERLLAGETGPLSGEAIRFG